MRFGRCLAVAVGAPALVFVACATYEESEPAGPMADAAADGSELSDVATASDASADVVVEGAVETDASSGHCVNGDAGDPCPDGRCDGNHRCVAKLGDPCEQADQCPSGFCVDGVCCDEACTRECNQCNGPTKGVCSNVPFMMEDPFYLEAESPAAKSCTQAVGGSACNGRGECRRTINVTCNDDAQCLSKECSQMKCLGAKGELCNSSSDCLSSVCAVGACQ